MKLKDPLSKSIEHWQEMINWVEDQPLNSCPSRNQMRNAINQDWGSKYCALCKDAKENCKNCQYAKYYNRQCDRDHTWLKVNNSQTWQKWLIHAEQMLSELKEIQTGKPSSYLEHHKASNLKVGDYVKVTRKAKYKENGWDNLWMSCMDETVGKTYRIVGDNQEDGFKLNTPDRLSYPYFVLKKPKKRIKPYDRFISTLIDEGYKPDIHNNWFPPKDRNGIIWNQMIEDAGEHLCKSRYDWSLFPFLIEEVEE